MHWAAQGGHIDTVQFLLEQGAAIEAKDQWHCTPLHRAAQNGHTATAAFLLDRGADLEAKSLSKRTPLHLAAEAGHTATGTVLLDRGADITAKHKDGYTPLHFAAQNGHTATAELLLQRGAAITAKEKCDYTPLHRAAQEGHTATAELLLQRGADITARDQWGYSPLHRAAQNDHTAIAEFLLDRGADLEAKDQWDYTPLHRAAQNGRTATTELLLKRGADVEAKDKKGQTPLEIAERHEEVAALLRAARAPGWRPQAHTPPASEATPSTIQAPAAKSSSQQVAKPPTSTTPTSSSRANVKDSPDLARAKVALKTAQEAHQKAQKTVEEAEQTLQEAQAATAQAQSKLGASLQHVQTIKQHVAHLMDMTTADNATLPNCVAGYLQDIVKQAQDYLQSLPKEDEGTSTGPQDQGHTLLTTLYDYRQQEQQYYRYIKQFYSVDATLSPKIRAQLLGEVLPQHQYHIDTLTHLIEQLVKKAQEEVDTKKAQEEVDTKKAQEEVDTARKNWVDRKVEAMAHDLNHQPLLDYLAGKDQNGINGLNAQGRTALHCAVLRNDFNIIAWLLKRGADVDAKDQWHYTPLHRAAQEGHTAIAALLLQRGADITARDQWGYSPLHRAAQKGHTATAELLLKRGAAITAKDQWHYTPLHRAVRHGHTATAGFLLDRGAGLEAKNLSKRTPLHLAAEAGHTATAELLLKRGAAITAKDKNGYTPLHWTSHNGHTATAELLLQRGADITARDQWGYSPLHRAAQNGHTATAAFLLDREADLEPKNLSKRPPLHLAAEAGHTATAELLLKRGDDITAKDECDYTSLHWAAHNGHTATTEFLLQRGADIAAKDQWNHTPLHRAAQNGHTATTALLLKRGAAITAKDKNGYTPLHWAAHNGHTATTEFLLQRGADIAAKDQWNHTPLHRAAQNGHTATTALLLKRGAAITARDQWGYSPLHRAAQYGHTATATVLLDRGAAITAKDECDYTPLHWAAQEGHTATAELLLQRGADITAKDERDDTPLHWAANKGHRAIVTLLLDHWADITARDQWGYSPLHHASEAGHTATAALLLKRGAAIAAKDQWNHTPLHRAAQNGHTATAELLLKRGAAITAKSKAGKTPLEIAVSQGHEEVATLLRAARAPGWCPQAHTTPASEATHTNVQSTPALANATEVFLNIVQLAQSLPTRLREDFQTDTAPILEAKLIRAPEALQKEVFQYFQKQGVLYPKILQQYPVEDWVGVSLLHDLIQGMEMSEVTHLHINLLAEKLRAQYTTDVLTAILWKLYDKKGDYIYTSDILCDVLEMLPEDGGHAQTILRLPDDQWHTALKADWLSSQIQERCLAHGTMQCQHLTQELSRLDWSLPTYQTLLAQLPPHYDAEDLSRLLALAAQHSIDQIQLQAILKTSTASSDCLPAHWHRQLACELLKEKLARCLPEEMQAKMQAIVEALRMYTPFYHAIDTFLDQLLLNQLQDKSASWEPEHLYTVLAIMRDYRLDEATYTKLLQQIVDLPSYQWSYHFYTQVMQHCFAEEAHERTVDEIIEYMAQHSPEVAYVQDKAKVRQDYNAILAAYQGPSTILSNANAIKNWYSTTITQWAETVKSYAKDPAQGIPPSQAEIISVIKRAAELHYGFAPRNTQILSLLALLNPTSSQGRLLQINTGEGKSLTVAMFSVIQALLNHKNDVVTTSTELSIPEVTKQRAFFEMLASSVAENSVADTHNVTKKKKQAYQQDNVYGTAGDFQGDILRTEFFGKEIRMHRPFDRVVVDEVDNMLFDSRSHSIRLSSTMPATNQLSILLASIWQRVKHISRHLIKEKDQVYFIEEDFDKDANGHITILSGEEKDPQKCMVPIEGDIKDFITKGTQGYCELLLRDLRSCEERVYEDSQTLEREIVKLRADLASAEDPDRCKSLQDKIQQLEEEHEALPWNDDKEKYAPIISVPAHLKNFARQQIPR